MAKPKQNWAIAVVVSCVVSIPASANTPATISKMKRPPDKRLRLMNFGIK
ncbi:MAG: hypothetical protein AAFU53_10260 [Cyanobacteria bacterium J06632_3]